MNTSKQIPRKFLASDSVDARVSNFANKHGKKVLTESRHLCKITPTRKHVTYKGGKIRESEHFAFKSDVTYQVWLYKTTDGSYIAHRICDGKKAIFEPGEFKQTDLKEIIQVNKKSLRQKVNGAGVTILAKA